VVARERTHSPGLDRPLAPPAWAPRESGVDGDSYALTRSALAPRRTPSRAVWAVPLAPTWSAIFFSFFFLFLFFFLFSFLCFLLPFFFLAYFLFFFCNIFKNVQI
jgi:hypothetical protein